MSNPITASVVRDGVTIPTALWRPHRSPRGIVLACHGGSGHKLSPAILAIAGECAPRGLAVLALDGPVHGGRRADGNLDPVVAKQSFRDAWRAGVGRTSMAHEMSAVLDEYLTWPEFAALPVGYIGVSMGTAYGLPFLASDRRIQAAVVGLWGTTYPASEHLAAYAEQVTCAVWFTQQWNDEFFERDGTFALFDAIGAGDKRLVSYPGPHCELDGERLNDALDFMMAKLGR